MKHKSSLKNSRGMTLIEILIVITIIGGIFGFLVNGLTKNKDNANAKQTKLRISKLRTAIESYYTDCSEYPADLNGLVTKPSNCGNWGPSPYASKEEIKDAWGKEFEYSVEGGTFTLMSYGKDRKPGGDGAAQDITSKEE